MPQLVRSLLAGQLVPRTATVNGWIRTIRKQKFDSFIQISDGSCNETLQIVARSGLASSLCTGCAITATGTLTGSIGGRQQVEMVAEKIELVAACDQSGYPFPKKQLTPEHMREHSHLRARSAAQMQIFAKRSLLMEAMNRFFGERDFIAFPTPILSTNDCEGGALPFDVACKENYFGSTRPTLTTSGQLHLEAAVCSAFPRVYNIGPCFRAENHHTKRHLVEFWMLEAEISFVDNADQIMGLVEECCKSAITAVSSAPDDALVLSEWPRVGWREALRLLAESGDFPGVKSLSSDHERYLAENIFRSPFFLVGAPKEDRPFYMRSHTGPDGSEWADCFDLIFPVYGEIAGGSMRENDYYRLHQAMSEQQRQTLRWYCDLRRFGSPPHGGFGIGIERLLQAILKIENIKDAIPFPRTKGYIRF